MSAKTKRISSGSSSSSAGEGKKPRDPEAEHRDLRAQVDQLMRQQKVEKGQGRAKGEGGLDEDWKMEVDEEVQRKKMLDEQRKRLQKQIREIEKFTNVDPLFQEDTGKSGRKNCMRLSRNGRISCRSIRKMQEMSQKLQSLQDKKNRCLKDAGTGDEEMEKISDEITEREAHFQELAQKSRNFRMAADDLEAEIRVLQAGEERRGRCASQSKGCFDSVMEHLFTFGAAHARQQV